MFFSISQYFSRHICHLNLDYISLPINHVGSSSEQPLPLSSCVPYLAVCTFHCFTFCCKKQFQIFFFFSLTWQLTCEQSLEQNRFWRDREHQSLDELNFIPKNEKSSYSPKLRLIYHTYHSFPLKQTETNSGGLERRGNSARLIVLVYRTCYLF